MKVLRAKPLLLAFSMILFTTAIHGQQSGQRQMHLFYPEFGFSITGGISQGIWDIYESPFEQLITYQKQLRSGYVLGADMSYYFSGYSGIGVKYNRFGTSNRMFRRDALGDPIWYIDQITDTYAGAYYTFRLIHGYGENELFLTAGLGYLHHRNKGGETDFELDGGSLGYSFDAGYDYKLADKVYIRVVLSLTTGTISEFTSNGVSTVNTVEMVNEDFGDITRLDLSAGIRFGL